MGANLEIDLDPKKVADSLKAMGVEAVDLSRTIETALGKDAAAAVGKLENAAEKGTTKIASYFRTLGTRVREDLKTAFDATGIIAGAKFARELGEGVKSVFDMERAFDRLQTRLKLTQKDFAGFKTDLGRKAAGTGQSLESILPGVEIAASRGGVKSSAELGQIGEMLGQAKATTGEGTEGLAEHVVEILKTQGQAVTAASFKATLDAISGTRTAGSFHNAGEAGGAIEQLSPYAKRLGLSTRELGGMAATASGAGAAGQDILRQLAERGADKDVERKKLEGVLGVSLFKNGKLDPSQIAKIDTKRFSGLSPEKMSEISGFTGSGGNDFVRFVEQFKKGSVGFQEVVSGSNETAAQYAVATQSLASGVDRFRQKTVEAGREVGEGLSRTAGALLKGNFSEAFQAGKDTLGKVGDNSGQIAAAGAITAGVGMLAGGSLNRLLGRVGGGGLAGGMAKGALASQAGITPVYVTNFSEFGGANGAAALLGAGSSGARDLEGFAGGAGKMGKLAKFGGMAAATGTAGLAVGAGLAAGAAVPYIAGGGLADDLKSVFSKVFGGKEEAAAYTGPMPQTADMATDLKTAVAAGIKEGMAGAQVKLDHKGPLTNPSAVKGTGGPR